MKHFSALLCNFIICIGISVTTTVATLAAAQTTTTTTTSATASTPQEYSCAKNGNVVVDGELHPTGIYITDTHYSNCTSVTVKNTLTPFVHFTDPQGMAGNASHIDIFSNVFQLLPQSQFPWAATQIPAVDGTVAVLAFAGAVSDLFSVMIYENIVNVTTAQAQAFSVFAKPVSTFSDGKGFHAGQNTWVPDFSAAAAPAGGNFAFFSFHGAVGPVGSWGLQLCHNNFTFLLPDAGGHNVNVYLLQFDLELSGVPITLWKNDVRFEAKNTFIFSPMLIKAAKAVTSPDIANMKAASPFFLSVRENTFVFRGAGRSSVAYTICSFFSFSGAVTGFTGATNSRFPDADWILLSQNKMEVALAANEVVFEVFSFSQAATISKMNVTRNTFLTDTTATILSRAYFSSFSQGIHTTRSSPSADSATVNFDSNVWYERRQGGGSKADGRWLHVEGDAGSSTFALDSVSFVGNTRRGSMNTTGTGEISVIWMNFEVNAGGGSTQKATLGAVQFRDNQNFPVVQASSSTQVFIALQRVETDVTGQLFIHNNYEGSQVVNSTAIFSYFAAQRLTVTAPVIVAYNTIAATRNSCGSLQQGGGGGGKGSCADSLPQNPMALHASLFTINANDVSFSKTVTFSWNKIQLQSDIAVDGASTAPSTTVPSILFPSGVSFLFVETTLAAFTADGAASMEMNDNKIQINFGAPTQQSGGDTTALNSRAPIAAVRVIDSRVGGTVDFGFTAKTLVFRRTVITATCAPCTASSVIFDASPSGKIQINSLNVVQTRVALSAPVSMNQALLPALYAVFGSVLSFCVPPAGSADYACAAANPGQIGPLGNPTAEIFVSNSTVSVDGGASATASFPPPGFQRSGFQMAVVAAANNSFGKVVTITLMQHNWFLYSGFSSGSANPVDIDNWWRALAMTGVATVLTAGGNNGGSSFVPPLSYDSQMQVAADCANFLGSDAGWNNLTSLFAVVGLRSQFRDICISTTAAPPTTSSTTLPPTTTTTTNSTPSTTSTTTTTTTTAMVVATTTTTTTTTRPTTTTTSQTSNSAVPTTTTASSSATTVTPTSPTSTVMSSTAAPSMSSTTVTTTTLSPLPPPPPTTTTSSTSAAAAAPPTTSSNNGSSSGGSGSSGAASDSSAAEFLGVGTGPGVGIIVGAVVAVAVVGILIWYKFGRKSGGSGSASNTHLLDDEGRKGTYRKSQSYLEETGAQEMPVSSPDMFRHTQEKF